MKQKTARASVNPVAPTALYFKRVSFVNKYTIYSRKWRSNYAKTSAKAALIASTASSFSHVKSSTSRVNGCS